MQWYFCPPVFEIEPETSFDEAWESFCSLILNLENETTEIHRRSPPDFGIDLFWQVQKIAYQCKAVASGKSGDFSATKAIASIQQAKLNRNITNWERYVICSNVEITGAQEEKIRRVLPSVEFLTPGYWRLACERHKNLITSRFRRLVRVSENTVATGINEKFLRSYVDELQRKFRKKSLTLLVYSNKRREIYEVPASPLMSVDDFLNVLISLFDLPVQHHHAQSGILMSLKYALMINNEAVPLNKKLSSVVKDRDIATLWKEIVCKDQRGQSVDRTVEFLTVNSLSLQERKQIAVSAYEQKIQEAFEQALKRLEQFETTQALG
jgi:hypothetical protein